MKAHTHRLLALPKRQLGLSLIELMVSMVIGLIIIVALLAAYQGTTGSGKVSNALGRMNEDAHGALTMLSQQLRMAGTNPMQAGRVETQLRNNLADKFFLFACDGGFTAITGTATSSLSCVTTGTVATPDAVSVAYEADIYNTASTNTIPRDCLGQTVATQTMVIGTGSVSFYQAANRYHIRNSSAGVTSLYCTGSGDVTNPQALVENVEDMQLTFGVSLPNTATGTIAGYLTATEIGSDVNLAALGTAEKKWARVVSARICVLMRSDQPVLDELTPYFKCDGTLETAPADKRLRRAYSTTVLMRNLSAAS